MNAKLLLKRYVWLLNTIYREKRISLSDLQEKWSRSALSEGEELTRSSFNRHKDAIEDMFGIKIVCDKSDGFKYSIENAERLNESSIENWMLSTLQLSNVIKESMSLRDKIILEPVPTANENLYRVIECMKEKKCVKIVYKKYGKEEGETKEIEPYCVKLYNRRWYVLGKRMDGEKRVYAMDRMVDVEEGTREFKIEGDFNAEEFFRDCMGVTIGDGSEAQMVTLRVFGLEALYIKDLPIHESQKESGKGDGYVDFDFWLRPTYEFKEFLMSRGETVKVVRPEWLAKEIRKRHEAAAKGVKD